MADTETDPRIVFVAENARIADAVIQLLGASGVPAELVDAGPPMSSALTGMTDEAATSFPIVVTDPTKVTAARELLATAETVSAVRAIREKREARTGTVTATCEDCGKPSVWPAAAMGTTEVCPHCAGYMDIPDPDDDWSNVDFGAADEEDK
ncbi:hypothetical protein [Frigoriglobus tundricola]|uniref:DUF2007 domain-containing protein n=1 Tax=Frigoriglobus tundricola TaxID=2774151 RepID=A0A6M5Z0E5_9BACT|nr:hypothetical protein [Frigoriglobus tundricola]QJW99264.1 hypothetical protein FTUN_6866 [Frigoriglobus tundricola]